MVIVWGGLSINLNDMVIDQNMWENTAFTVNIELYSLFWLSSKNQPS